VHEIKNYNHALSRTSTQLIKYDFPKCAPANLETSCPLEISDVSRKLRLRCGCQFPWCALALIEEEKRKEVLGRTNSLLSFDTTLSA
jgi:hypothetical protein